MLLWIAIVILILWALGFFVLKLAGGLIHLLLIIAVVVLIRHFMGRRKVG